MTATTSPAIVRSEYASCSGSGDGPVDLPYPRRSGQTTVRPDAASRGATRHQVVWVRG